MSDYVFKKGKEAKEYVDSMNADYTKQLHRLKDGEPVMVKLASDDDYIVYFSHSAYGAFQTTLCHEKAGKGKDLYDKASELLYNEYFDRLEKGEDKKSPEMEELRQQAYTLKPKLRYLFGFFDLTSGEQILVDMTENQGDSVIKSIDKYAGKIDKIAFELVRHIDGTKTTVSLMPVLDMDEDLTDKQRKNFDKLVEEDAAIDDSAYGKVFQFRDELGQAEDLQAFGFDLERIGVDIKALKQASANGEDGDAKPVEGEENPEDAF